MNHARRRARRRLGGARRPRLAAAAGEARRRRGTRGRAGDRGLRGPALRCPPGRARVRRPRRRLPKARAARRDGPADERPGELCMARLVARDRLERHAHRRRLRRLRRDSASMAGEGLSDAALHDGRQGEGSRASRGRRARRAGAAGRRPPAPRVRRGDRARARVPHLVERRAVRRFEQLGGAPCAISARAKRPKEATEACSF